MDHFENGAASQGRKRPLDVSVTISPVKGPTGLIIGVSKVARDITSIKRILLEREELLKRETAARAEAERVSLMKDDFLATLSHELRTPLNAILGWATILRMEGACTPEEFEQGIEIIERNAHAQAELIEELLDMSRIINGKLRLDVQPVDLLTVISDAIESIRPAAEGKGIRLVKVLDPKARRDQRRSEPAATSALEPSYQRRQIHVQGGARSSFPAPRELSRRDQRFGFRSGNFRGFPAASFRSLLSSGYFDRLVNMADWDSAWRWSNR